MRLIINEKQVKSLIDIIIIEQNVNISRGGTDVRSASHNYLTINHGLPNGSKYENYYYSADIKDVINHSKTGNLKNFLMVFNPVSKYSENPKKYMDYVNINGEILTQEDINNKISKTFDFVDGTITGTHNGLLNIARAMENLNGKPGIITLNFGKYDEGESAEKERLSQGVTFNSKTTFNHTSTIKGLSGIIAIAAVRPEWRKYSSLYSWSENQDDNALIERIKNWINNIIIGSGGFIDPNNNSLEKIVGVLKPKGYITNSDFDIEPLFNSLKNLRTLDEKKLPFTGNFKDAKEYNLNKYEKITEISNQFMPDLISDIKQKYIHNLKIFVENYLPEMKNSILKNLENKIIFPVINIGIMHKTQFTSTSAGGGTPPSGILQTTSTTYK